jgi:hypothetical protein
MAHLYPKAFRSQKGKSLKIGAEKISSEKADGADEQWKR